MVMLDFTGEPPVFQLLDLLRHNSEKVRVSLQGSVQPSRHREDGPCARVSWCIDIDDVGHVFKALLVRKAGNASVRQLFNKLGHGVESLSNGDSNCLTWFLLITYPSGSVANVSSCRRTWSSRLWFLASSACFSSFHLSWWLQSILIRPSAIWQITMVSRSGLVASTASTDFGEMCPMLAGPKTVALGYWVYDMVTLSR